MAKWSVIGVVFDGEPIDVGGLNPWEYEWHRVDVEPVELPHPQYASQMHQMQIYQIKGDEKTVIFAAAELSPNVWGFYSPIR